MTQRTRDEIISLILQSAGDGATQTTLMYETYLTHDAVKHYLALLLEKGFLQYLAGEMKFKTTVQGKKQLLSIQKKSSQVTFCCNHQCKKCGVLYSCGADLQCHNPFYHGVCVGCVKMFRYENTGNAEVRS
jgi:predicted transcriptional regulator